MIKEKNLKAILLLFAASLASQVSWASATDKPAEVEKPSALPAPTESASAPVPASSPARAVPSAPDGAAAVPPVESKAQFTFVSRAVGEVGEIIVTSREVRINQAIDLAISGRSKSVQTPAVMTGVEKNFPLAVEQVLDEWVIHLEAKSLSAQSLVRGDPNESARLVQEMWSSRSDWQALEVSQEEIRAIIERKLSARAFVRLKSDPELVPVSDEDALAYYQKNRLRFGSSPFSSFKENIKAHLVKQQTERRLSEWREVLRRKYKVRNFIAG